MSIPEILKQVISHHINVMHLLVVELVCLLAAVGDWDSVDNLRLVLEDVGHVDVLAEILGQLGDLIDLNTEEDLFAE